MASKNDVAIGRAFKKITDRITFAAPEAWDLTQQVIRDALEDLVFEVTGSAHPGDLLVTLPIPLFDEVLETHQAYGKKIVVLICPDPLAGHPHRYSVILLNRETGVAETLGRELPLTQSRSIAMKKIYLEENP